MPDSISDAPLIVVANPRSGNGRAPHLMTTVVDALRLFGPIRAICEETKAATDAALAATVGDARAVVAIGGDGLIHCVAQHLAGTGIPLGIIPAGSGNDIARALRLQRKTDAALAEIINALTWPEFTQDIDLLRVEGADFSAWVVAVVSLGLDAKVNYRAVNQTAHWGRWRYVAALVGELVTLGPDTYEIAIDGAPPRRVSGLLAAVANLGYVGSGMQIAPMARGKDGIGELIMVANVTRRTLATVFPRIYRGTHVSHPAVRHERGRTFVIGCDDDIIVHGDGEALGSMPVEVRVEPAALSVLAAKEEWIAFDE